MHSRHQVEKEIPEAALEDGAVRQLVNECPQRVIGDRAHNPAADETSKQDNSGWEIRKNSHFCFTSRRCAA